MCIYYDSQARRVGEWRETNKFVDKRDRYDSSAFAAMEIASGQLLRSGGSPNGFTHKYVFGTTIGPWLNGEGRKFEIFGNRDAAAAYRNKSAAQCRIIHENVYVLFSRANRTFFVMAFLVARCSNSRTPARC